MSLVDFFFRVFLEAGFDFVIANKMEFYAVEKNVSSGMERQREDYKSKCSIHTAALGY
jgi:hypothetical protein